MLVAQSYPALHYPMDCSPTKLLYLWNSLGKNTGMGSHSLLQCILLAQGSNPDLLYCRQILYCLNPQGSPITFANPKEEGAVVAPEIGFPTW